MPALRRFPFPYFGGKEDATELVWERFGRLRDYRELFAGTAAVATGCPWPIEEWPSMLLNDRLGRLVNFLRAVDADPAAVAKHASWPIGELDIRARRRWLLANEDRLRKRLDEDPDYFEAKAAGWYAWLMSSTFGGDARDIPMFKPKRGVNADMRFDCLPEYFAWLGKRLRRSIITCGDFARHLPNGIARGPVGVFLDPPYSRRLRDRRLYASDTEGGKCPAVRARDWAIEHGDDPRLRIALCGLEGEHEMPASWECVAWVSTCGGLANQGKKGNRNRWRERIWFSPHCLKPAKYPLLEASYD